MRGAVVYYYYDYYQTEHYVTKYCQQLCWLSFLYGCDIVSRNNLWTKEEEKKLREVYNMYDMDTIKKMFPNHKAIMSKAHKLGINRKKYWQAHKSELVKRQLQQSEQVNIPKRTLSK